mgnify:CR=1 FL=1
MYLVILGLVFEIVGALIFTLVAIFNHPHQRDFREKWWKRYWWMGWCPFSKINPPSGKSYWKIKWTHKVVRPGFIPPKHQWNIVGFLYILIGFLLQLRFYLT